MGRRRRSERHGGLPLHEGRRIHHVSGRRHGRWLHGQRVDDVAVSRVGHYDEISFAIF